jgi:hypothetical protein
LGKFEVGSKKLPNVQQSEKDRRTEITNSSYLLPHTSCFGLPMGKKKQDY